MSDQSAARPAPLAILPNGEAVRPEEVSRVLIEAAASLVEEAGERFSVAVHLHRRHLSRGGRQPVAAGRGGHGPAVRPCHQRSRAAGLVKSRLGGIGRWLGRREPEPPPKPKPATQPKPASSAGGQSPGGACAEPTGTQQAAAAHGRRRDRARARGREPGAGGGPDRAPVRRAEYAGRSASPTGMISRRSGVVG